MWIATNPVNFSGEGDDDDDEREDKREGKIKPVFPALIAHLKWVA